MITQKDQLNLFALLGNELNRDITTYAFGGTAMMFYGYKNETKDIDLLFEKEPERIKFIETLKQVGYTETSPVKIYIPEKLKDPNRPLMFKRGDVRFDLFVKQIFHTKLSPKMQEELFAVHEFKASSKLTIKVLRKEHLVMLKAVTERQNDFDDIKSILQKDKDFDWQLLIDEVIWQYQNGDQWVLLDVEKMLNDLKEHIFVEEKYLKQLHGVKEDYKD